MQKRMLAASLLLLGLIAVSLASDFAQAATDEPNELIARGNEAFHHSQFERAIFLYHEALQWPGAHAARAHFNLGVCHHRRGNLRAAADEYRAALRLKHAQYPMASYALGVVLHELGQQGQARAAFAEAVEASAGKHAGALFELGLAAQRVGEWQTALEFYQRANAQAKDALPACHNNVGVILAASGALDEAAREFELALKVAKGRFAEARNNLVLCRAIRSASDSRMIAALDPTKFSVAQSRVAMRCE